MAKVKISQLPANTNPSLSGVTAIVDGNVTYKTTLDAIKTKILADFTVVDLGFATTGSNVFYGDQTISGSVYIDQNQAITGNHTISGYQTVGSYQTVMGDQTVEGTLIIGEVNEVLTVDGGFSSNTFDLSNGGVFYLTGLTGNGIWNVINVPTTNNRATTMTFVVVQDATPYSGSQYQINGSSVSVKWVDGVIPSGSANVTNVIGLTAFRVNSSWDVYGQISSWA